MGRGELFRDEPDADENHRRADRLRRLQRVRVQ